MYWCVRQKGEDTTCNFSKNPHGTFSKASDRRQIRMMLQDLWLGFLLNYIFLICFIQWARYDRAMRETEFIRRSLGREIDEYVYKIVKEEIKPYKEEIKSLEQAINEVAKKIKER